MANKRYIGVILVNGNRFHDGRFPIDAHDTKMEVVKELGREVEQYLIPRLLAENNVQFVITDTESGEVTIV